MPKGDYPQLVSKLIKEEGFTLKEARTEASKRTKEKKERLKNKVPKKDKKVKSDLSINELLKKVPANERETVKKNLEQYSKTKNKYNKRVLQDSLTNLILTKNENINYKDAIKQAKSLVKEKKSNENVNPIVNEITPRKPRQLPRYKESKIKLEPVKETKKINLLDEIAPIKQGPTQYDKTVDKLKTAGKVTLGGVSAYLAAQAIKKVYNEYKKIPENQQEAYLKKIMQGKLKGKKQDNEELLTSEINRAKGKNYINLKNAGSKKPQTYKKTQPRKKPMTRTKKQPLLK